jgi:hypothetical protein
MQLDSLFVGSQEEDGGRTSHDHALLADIQHFRFWKLDWGNKRSERLGFQSAEEQLTIPSRRL